MSKASTSFVGRLDDISDWLSPIVVKEVRQIVRGREFNYSFGLSLLAGLLVAFFGGADAVTGRGTAGAWTFGALMSCLMVIGLLIVPIGTFHTLRNERAERTLDLITLTALSPRRMVVGKLLAQCVKLVTLFAALAPFIAMSFLLGGIDFVTILISLAALFMWSMWLCAFCLFLSCVSKSRAASALIFGLMAILFLFLMGPGGLFFFMGRTFFGPGYYGGPPGGPFALMSRGTGSEFWWMMGIMTAVCLMTMTNLVLLAENRLTLPTEDRVTALRLGLFAQFLLILASVLLGTFVFTTATAGRPPGFRSAAIDIMGVAGGLQLAIVAAFTVTEPLTLSRRILQQEKPSSGWSFRHMFRPGGGRGALYVLVQMALLLVAGVVVTPAPWDLRWLLAICGYICFFTGVPAYLGRRLVPGRLSAAQLRVGAFVLLPVVMLVPDLVAYVVAPAHTFSFEYTTRHVVNPFRTLANWPLVETNGWQNFVFVLGMIGFASYAALMKMAQRSALRKGGGETDAGAAD